MDTGAARRSCFQGDVFICAMSHPDPSRDFDGKIGIWRGVGVRKMQRTSRRDKGEDYAVDVTIDLPVSTLKSGERG